MYLGKVIGSVWATQKHDSLIGEKMQLVQPLNAKREPIGKAIVAIDTAGAGAGETVIYVTSSEAATPIKARKKTKLVPTDATIVGIVDRIDIDGAKEI